MWGKSQFPFGFYNVCISTKVPCPTMIKLIVLFEVCHAWNYSFILKLRTCKDIFYKINRSLGNYMYEQNTLSKSKNASFISNIKSIEIFLSLTRVTSSSFSTSLRRGTSIFSCMSWLLLFLDTFLHPLSLECMLRKSPFLSWKSLRPFSLDSMLWCSS